MKYIICENLDINKPILTLNDWKSKCAPKGGDSHWVEGRSAYENAYEWIMNKGINLENLMMASYEFSNFSNLM